MITIKIGIFGGTFNPPHKGHTRLAKEAADFLGLDKLIIMPACIPPHKLPGRLADGRHRTEMCRIAFGNIPGAEVSTLELEKGDTSYTVETLRILKEKYPSDELYFILGSDMLESFRRWYCWEEILSLATICAASRENGFIPDLDGYTEEQKKRFVFLNIEPLEVSSTQIRMGKANELLDEKILRYISENALYDDGLDSYRQLLKEKLDEKRIYHSECVSECAAELAVKYGADPDKARLAGLMHDVMKNAGREEHFRYMKNPSSLEIINHKVWHQISAENYLRENGIITDDEILSAIRWHTTGRAGMSLLEKIVYIADFISADRNYNDVEVVRSLARQSLEDAILYTSRYTISKLASNDMLLHPATVDCYNDMLLQKGKD